MANTSTQSSVCKARLYKICREVLKGNQKIASNPCGAAAKTLPCTSFQPVRLALYHGSQSSQFAVQSHALKPKGYSHTHRRMGFYVSMGAFICNVQGKINTVIKQHPLWGIPQNE